MAKGFFDKHVLSIPCPQCGHKNEKAVGWLKSNQRFTCVSCGVGIDLESDQFRREMGKVDRSIKDFQREIERLNKLLKF